MSLDTALITPNENAGRQSYWHWTLNTEKNLGTMITSVVSHTNVNNTDNLSCVPSENEDAVCMVSHICVQKK